MKLFNFVFVLLVVLSLAWPAAGSPVFDPFVEKFQVGEFRDPADIILQNGYPAGLMEPLRLDRTWLQAAATILNPAADSQTAYLTRSLLSACRPESAAAQSWLFHHHKRLQELELEKLPAGEPFHVGGRFLLAERLAVRSFLAYQEGELSQAGALARRLVVEGQELGLRPREVFVWDLRARFLASEAGGPTGPLEQVWTTLFDLGSFDSGNAWAIWVTHQRSLNHPVIPGGNANPKLGRFLGRLRRTWLTTPEFNAAGFASDMKAALGAKILQKSQLTAHFKAFPNPPRDFTLQGWWVAGQRRLQLGHAGHYEQLAARTDLKPGWQMDVYRRASEIHILAGRWGAGLADFKKALLLAQKGQGTKSLRRRLRRWNEQAIALASAQGDTLLKNELLALGQAYFISPEREVFADQTVRWGSIETGSTPEISAKFLVSRGLAPDFLQNDQLKAEVFANTVDDPLWDLWFKWGLQIGEYSSVGSESAHKLMLAGSKHTQKLDQLPTIMGIAANRFEEAGHQEILLRMVLEFDIGKASGWTTVPRQSPIPDLVKKGDLAAPDRHALLGIALTTGDMRGILAAALGLPRCGLTVAQKQQFLYPLPPEGPIRNALEAAHSDPALILAVARNESLFDPAVRSRAGALGFMQIMPFHYDSRGAVFGPGHWSQPAVSIAFGDRLLQEGASKYQGDPYMSLAGYNAGHKPTARWLKQLGGSSTRQEFGSWIGYPETRYYVEKVLIDREIYSSIISASGRKQGP